jgi:hypothetical protein
MYKPPKIDHIRYLATCWFRSYGGIREVTVVGPHACCIVIPDEIWAAMNKGDEEKKTFVEHC